MQIRKSKGEITLPWGTPQDILLYEDLNAPILVHSILLCKQLRVVYDKHVLYHSDKVYQIKFHGYSSQMLLIGLEIGNMLLIYYQSFWAVRHK